MPTPSIYLDHSASTPVDERVLEAMLPYFGRVYGNPSGVHSFARGSEKAVEDARQTLAQIFGCQPKEIVFTSCGTESDNLALRGVMWAAQAAGETAHMVTSPIEHTAVSKTALQLRDVFGCGLSYPQMSQDGMISPEALAAAMTDETRLVSLMLANNEIGTVLPIADLAEVAHQRGAVFHTDAVQAAGQLSLDVNDLNVDLMSISGHKFYGPKGVGALYVRDGVQLKSAQTGGSHEAGRRAGTMNVPLIVGLAKALDIATAERESRVRRLQTMRDQLIEGILSRVDDVQLTGHPDQRLPSHASFVFKNVDGNQLLMMLDNKGIGASAGSACKVGNPEPSDVLVHLGYGDDWTLGGLRLSVGIHTTQAEIDYTVETLPNLVEKVRLFNALSA